MWREEGRVGELQRSRKWGLEGEMQWLDNVGGDNGDKEEGWVGEGWNEGKDGEVRGGVVDDAWEGMWGEGEIERVV